MHGLREYVLALACIFAVNLLPAFGPPTWALLVFFKLNSDLAAPPLVLGGAVVAASGRLTLAYASRRFRGRLSPKRLASLAVAQRALTGDRRRTAGGLALFALSPVPSAQLFVAAGLLAVPLVPLTCAFFAGRLVSYSLYVGGASLAAHSLKGALTDAFSSPLGIALQVLMLAGLVALVRIDWTTALDRHARTPRSGGEPAVGEQDNSGPGEGDGSSVSAAEEQSSKAAGPPVCGQSGSALRPRGRRRAGRPPPRPPA